MFVIRSSELNAGDFPKYATSRSLAQRAARRNGVALYVDPGTAIATKFFVDHGKLRQKARGPVRFLHGC